MPHKRLTRYDRLLLPDPADEPTLRRHVPDHQEVMYVVVRPYKPPKRDPIYHTQVKQWPLLVVGAVLRGWAGCEVTRYRLTDGSVYSVSDSEVVYRSGRLRRRRPSEPVSHLNRRNSYLPREGLVAEPLDHFVRLQDPEGAEGCGLGFRCIRPDVVRPYELARDRPSAWERLARDVGGTE